MSALAWLTLSVAGGLGAVCRFLVDSHVSASFSKDRPLGTVVVNVSACLLLGLLTGWAGAASASPTLLTVLGTGFLGGYSTFSTASVEGARLLLEGRTGEASLHALGTATVSLLAAVLGLTLGSLLG